MRLKIPEKYGKTRLTNTDLTCKDETSLVSEVSDAEQGNELLLSDIEIREDGRDDLQGSSDTQIQSDELECAFEEGRQIGLKEGHDAGYQLGVEETSCKFISEQHEISEEKERLSTLSLELETKLKAATEAILFVEVTEKELCEQVRSEAVKVILSAFRELLDIKVLSTSEVEGIVARVVESRGKELLKRIRVCPSVYEIIHSNENFVYLDVVESCSELELAQVEFEWQDTIEYMDIVTYLNDVTKSLEQYFLHYLSGNRSDND